MTNDIMTPDRRGFIRVYVGGKYRRWERQVSVEPGDDVVFLAPLGEPVYEPLVGEHPDQLSLADDPLYDTFILGDSHD